MPAAAGSSRRRHTSSTCSASATASHQVRTSCLQPAPPARLRLAACTAQATARLAARPAAHVWTCPPATVAMIPYMMPCLLPPSLPPHNTPCCPTWTSPTLHPHTSPTACRHLRPGGRHLHTHSPKDRVTLWHHSRPHPPRRQQLWLRPALPLPHPGPGPLLLLSRHTPCGVCHRLCWPQRSGLCGQRPGPAAQVGYGVSRCGGGARCAVAQGAVALRC